MKDELISTKDDELHLPSMAALRTFEKAATLGTFAAAAAELGRTPSAVSHAVKELEDQLGLPLFNRKGRSIQLTAAGTQYHDAVRKMLNELRIATSALRRRRDTNMVRISALPFFTSTILLPNLNRFETSFPDLELKIETSNSYTDVANGETDIAIRFGDAHSQGLVTVPLIQVSGQPVAAPEYLRDAPALESPEDLHQHTLIHVRQNPSAWSNWYNANASGELQPKRDLTFDSILGALDAVQRGAGIALAMHPLIQNYPGYGRSIIPIWKRTTERSAQYNFICQKPVLGDRKIHRTLQWLKESVEFQTMT